MDGQSSPVSLREPSPANARIFTAKARDRWGMTGIGAVCLLGAGAVPFFLEPNQSPLLMAGICVAMGLVFLFIGEFVLARRRLVLSHDGAEFRTLLGTRTLAASAIKGFRRGGGDKHPTLVLIPRESATKKLSLPLSLDHNGGMQAWAAAHFPDLDAIEMQTDLEAILADDEFGFTVEERQAFLNRQQLLFKILSGAAFGVALWAWMFPRPYEVVMAAQVVVALFALAGGALGRGLMTLWPTSKAHPTASIGLMMPGLILLGRGVLDFDVVSWQSAIPPIAAGSALWVFLMVMSFKDARKSLVSMGVAATLGLLLGAGSALQWNVLADKGESVILETLVVDKRESHGKHDTYTLVLAPWKEGEKAVVEYTSEKELYDAVEAGQPVWVWTEPGALRIPWYFVTTPQE